MDTVIQSKITDCHFLYTQYSHTGRRMGKERVQSKHLFCFQPQGFVDNDIVAYDEKMKAEFNVDREAMAIKMKNSAETAGLRATMDTFMGAGPFTTDPAYVEVSPSPLPNTPHRPKGPVITLS